MTWLLSSSADVCLVILALRHMDAGKWGWYAGPTCRPKFCPKALASIVLGVPDPGPPFWARLVGSCNPIDVLFSFRKHRCTAGPCLWIFCWFLGKNWRGPGALGTLGAPLLLICATCPHEPIRRTAAWLVVLPSAVLSLFSQPAPLFSRARWLGSAS